MTGEPNDPSSPLEETPFPKNRLVGENTYMNQFSPSVNLRPGIRIAEGIPRGVPGSDLHIAALVSIRFPSDQRRLFQQWEVAVGVPQGPNLLETIWSCESESNLRTPRAPHKLRCISNSWIRGFNWEKYHSSLGYMGMAQNLVTLVNIKIARKWMFIPLKMVFIGIDPWPHQNSPSLVPFHVRNSHPHVVPQTPGFFGARWAPGHLIQELRVHALGAFPQPLHRALQDGQPQDLEMWRGRSPEIDWTWHGARDFLKRSWDIKWYKPAKNGWNWLIIWSDVLLSILQQQKNKRIVGWALGRSRIKVRITILARAEKTRIIYTVYYDD